jgi:hypothetical protein
MVGAAQAAGLRSCGGAGLSQAALSFRIESRMMAILVVALVAGVVIGVAVLTVDLWRVRPSSSGWSTRPRNQVAEHFAAAEELAEREAAVAASERLVERSMADAEASFAEATARIEAREAVLVTREAELQQRESELAERQRALAERELVRTGAVSTERGNRLRQVDSDWWDKQLGHTVASKD